MKDVDMCLFDAMASLFEGKDSSKIVELIEKRAQREVVSKVLLPKKANFCSLDQEVIWKDIPKNIDFKQEEELKLKNNMEWTKNQYEEMGIKIIGDCETNDLFYEVELPEGWSVKQTDHPLWNDVFDDKQRRRAHYFYKAFDDAFINFDKRFYVSVIRVPFISDGVESIDKCDFQGVVKDCGNIVFSTSKFPSLGNKQDIRTQDMLYNILYEFMNQTYPNYKDINAYW